MALSPEPKAAENTKWRCLCKGCREQCLAAVLLWTGAAALHLVRQASGYSSSDDLKLEIPVQAAARKEAKQKRNANKWIFVTSADGQQLYVAPKVKGNFQHSSFLAGEHTNQYSLLGVPSLNNLHTGPNIPTCTAVSLLPLL